MSLFSGKNKKIKHANTHIHTRSQRSKTREIRSKINFQMDESCNRVSGSPGNVNATLRTKFVNFDRKSKQKIIEKRMSFKSNYNGERQSLNGNIL